jgi:tRNA threonylcarbamoyladenosine biosynthesis protein TsaB
VVSLLAIECSTEIASVALAVGDGIVERVFPDGARQSECIVQGIDQLLSEAGIEGSGIDGVAVSVGPGAFTGVRLAIAAAQGLALSWDRPVVPVSSLAALAAGYAPDRGEHVVLSLLDARMGEVYAGWFSVSARKVRAIGDEAVLAPDSLVRPAGVSGYTVLGSGLKSHMPVVFEALGEPLLSDSNARPRAGQVARLAWQMWPSNCVSADAVEATYLRNKVALTSAERAAVSVKR